MQLVQTESGSTYEIDESRMRARRTRVKNDPAGDPSWYRVSSIDFVHGRLWLAWEGQPPPWALFREITITSRVVEVIRADRTKLRAPMGTAN